MWRGHPLLGLGMTLFAALAMAFMVKIQAIAIPWWRAVRSKRAAFFGFLGEQLGGTQDLRANGGAPHLMPRFTGVHREWLPLEVRGRFGFSLLWSSSIAVYVFGLALVFALGSSLAAAGAMTLGAVARGFQAPSA